MLQKVNEFLSLRFPIPTTFLQGRTPYQLVYINKLSFLYDEYILFPFGFADRVADRQFDVAV